MKTIKATANQQKRTFTLRVFNVGSPVIKYRTVQLSKNEFDSCEYNTNNDWIQFLKSSDYYIVK